MNGLDAKEVLPAIGLLALGFVVIPASLIAVATDTEPRMVRCPETGAETLVQLDAKRAIRSMFTSAPPKIGACSRWPGRVGCDQGCLWQL